MADEFVFRFMALREPSEKAPRKGKGRKRIGYSVTGAQPPLAHAVLDIPVKERTTAAIHRITAEFKKSNRYVPDLGKLPLDPTPLVRWVDDHAAQRLKDLDLPAFVRQAYDKTPAALVKAPAFVETCDRLAETLFAEAFGDANRERRRDDLVQAIKALYLVSASVSEADLFNDEELLGTVVGRLLVTLPVLAQAEPEAKPPTVRPGKRTKEEDPGIKAVRERLGRLAATHRELVAALSRPDAIRAEAHEMPTAAPAAGVGASRIEAIEANVARLALRLDKPEGEALAISALRHADVPSDQGGVLVSRPRLQLASKAGERLSSEARSTLASLELDPGTSNPFAAVSAIEGQMSQLSGQLPVQSATKKMVAFGGVALDLATFAESLGALAGVLDVGTLPLYQPCQLKAGIGDLLIVRQKLKAYELADFAHVENVMRGETRSREHRRLDLREEITTEETEREVEKERNLQSTERNEMQNEASKTVQSQFTLDAGMQVSGSYGPAVSFSASLNTGFSTSVQETQRKAVSYSREVTDKTSERIRERVREERRVRVLEQIEEINFHKLENNANPTGHVRGIYRWLNKIYDAQVFNYGQRMMYEFVVPEPAAYFLYAMVENPPQDMELEKPEPPTYAGMPLKPENLSRTNYQQYLAQYDVTSAKAPPSSFTNVAYFEKQEGREESHYERASKVAIPEGYEAVGASAWYWYAYSNDKAKLKLAVGGYENGGWVSFSSPFRGEISVGVHAFYMKAFVATVDILCSLTDAGFAKWQHDTFAAIVEAYLNKKAAYDEKLEQLKVQKGVQILGRNPLENQRLTREELKKLALMMLMRKSHLDVDSFYGGAEPFMNLAKACTNGASIRFFENAFEWNNATWVFYPYMWARHARWITALHLTDPDPDFAAFLRAGAARLQVPVRPGFERAVAYYCQTGAIWDGNDVPLIGDDLYVPIIEEITEKLGKLDEGVPFPPDSQPWEVTVPTSLVVVQDLEEIPAIRDILTGQPINLLPPHA